MAPTASEKKAAAEAAAKAEAEAAAAAEKSLTGDAGATGAAIPPDGAPLEQGDPSGQQDPGAMTGDGPTVQTPDGDKQPDDGDGNKDDGDAGEGHDAKPEAPEGEVYEHPEPQVVGFVRQDNVTEPGVQVTQSVFDNEPQRHTPEDAAVQPTNAIEVEDDDPDAGHTDT